MHPLTVKAFNLAYYHKQLRIKHASRVFYDPFFYPLDAVHDWNRIYGKRGFYQYQCVVPFSSGTDAIREILGEISRAKLGSFLAVLKTFGDKPSLGMMSFPRPGVTLALDFANSGQDVLKLFDRLDAITRAAGGSVYIAKDARMSAASFRQYYPRWQEFTHFVDPRFSSSFWGRVTESA
jgi:FAD/FMN-containing dehydrogenase